MAKTTKKRAESSPKDLLCGSRVFQEVLVTQSEAEALLAEWQKRLGLQEWAVILSIKPQHKMYKDDAQGAVTGDTYKSIAKMEIVSPETYEDDWGVPQDMEHTIVHELAHVLLYPLKIKEELIKEEEVIVDRLATALVALKRGR